MKRKQAKSMKGLALMFVLSLTVSSMGTSIPVMGEASNVTTNGVIYQVASSHYDAGRPSSRNSVLSPRAIQLQYQENQEDNGKMLSTWETSIVELIPERQGKHFPIYESEDYGETWQEVGKVVETQRQDWTGEWEIENCPHLFELPEDVGEMKKGGILCFGDICPRDLSSTCLDMYYSEDMGRTWEFMSSVVTDGGANYMGVTPGPVWEPFVLYDPVTKTIVCYYSDERDPKYGQKLVLQYTADGKNWSEIVDVVAQTDTDMRPGMPVVAQMTNGYYVMVFEGVGLNYAGQGIPCNYKISQYPNDPIHWEAEDIGFTFAYGGSPYVTTLKSGHIVMNAGTESDVWINTKPDLSGAFIKYPTGVPDGYNRQVLFVDDGTERGVLYTLSCEYPDTGRPNSVKWGKLDLNTVSIPDMEAARYEIISDTQNKINLWPDQGQVIAGTDQYFMVEPKRGYRIQQIFVNGQPADLQKSWFKVENVNRDLNITVTASRTSEDARQISSKEEEKFFLCLPGYSTQDGREVFEWTYENHNNFFWVIEPNVEKGAYRIRNMNSNMYLAAKDVALAEKANVIQTSVCDDKALWKITEVEDGWFRIINYSSGLAITRGKMGEFGTPTERFAVQKPYVGTDDQLWGIDYVLQDLKQYRIICDASIVNGTVTPDFRKEAGGVKVYLTVTPDEGCKLVENSLKVNGKPVQGNSFVMPYEDVVITARFTAEELELPYVDVEKSDWYYNAVYYNYSAKTMTGLDETHFGPASNLLRAQIAMILYRIHGEPDTAYKEIFPDVEDGEWYTDAILWADSAGIVTGYTDTGLFGPADKVTREQMAVMMYRYATYLKYDTSVKADFSKFSDAEDVSAFAKEAMQWAVGNKIMTGKNNEIMLDPQGSVNRAECSAIIMRFMKVYNRK